MKKCAVCEKDISNDEVLITGIEHKNEKEQLLKCIKAKKEKARKAYLSEEYIHKNCLIAYETGNYSNIGEQIIPLTDFLAESSN